MDMWSQAVEFALQQASTPRSAQGLAKIRLGRQPVVRFLTRVSRSAAMIDKGLSGKIGECVAGESPWPLFVNGPAGTGKTCAALSLLDFLEFGGGKYITAAQLAIDLIELMHGRLSWYVEGRGGQYSTRQFWDEYANAPLVVLDEIGCRDKVTDHQYEGVKRLLDERSGRPLMILSNHDLETLARLYDDRIASRIAGGTVVLLGGADRRLRK